MKKVTSIVGIALLALLVVGLALTAFDKVPGTSKTKTVEPRTVEEAAASTTEVVNAQIAGVGGKVAAIQCVRVNADVSAEDTTGKSPVFACITKLTGAGQPDVCAGITVRYGPKAIKATIIEASQLDASLCA